jgi:hypothetical protein
MFRPGADRTASGRARGPEKTTSPRGADSEGPSRQRAGPKAVYLSEATGWQPAPTKVPDGADGSRRSTVEHAPAKMPAEVVLRHAGHERPIGRQFGRSPLPGPLERVVGQPAGRHPHGRRSAGARGRPRRLVRARSPAGCAPPPRPLGAVRTGAARACRGGPNRSWLPRAARARGPPLQPGSRRRPRC